jgi:U3 small nucleolar RNA-associated protein 14
MIAILTLMASYLPNYFSALLTVKAGWGDWAGPGASGVSTKILDIRNRLLKKVNEDSDNKKRGRKDTKMPNVMISDRRVKTAAKYKISEIPHPFTTREEYERSLQMPLGGESFQSISNLKQFTGIIFCLQ